MDDEIERIHKEGRSEKEREGSKGDDGGEDDNAREIEEREGAASLEDVSDDNEIYGAIDSGQGTTTTNSKAAKDYDDKEGHIMGIPHFWVCAMGHMEAVSKSIT